MSEKIKDDLAIYIHWPFCTSKCPYCDFNSHVRAEVDQKSMAQAYIRELKNVAKSINGNAGSVSSIFFGGGTPSLMPPKTVEQILHTISDLWQINTSVEITMEANPGSTDEARFSEYKTNGVNRLSLGVQSLNESALKFLGREHSVKDSLSSINVAAKLFSRVSLDLIYGRPKQSSTSWEQELSAALKLPIQHISLYQLTIEKGTPFYSDVRKRKFIMPENDTQAEMFKISNLLTKHAGMSAYEISNYALPGEFSRHNFSYWLYSPYVGVGPGAHGRLPILGQGRIATRGHAKPETWVNSVQTSGHGFASSSSLTQNEMAYEALMLGLRLKRGIKLTDFENKTGVSIEKVILAQKVNELKAARLIDDSNHYLRLTEKGWPLLNSILNRIIF